MTPLTLIPLTAKPFTPSGCGRNETKGHATRSCIATGLPPSTLYSYVRVREMCSDPDLASPFTYT